MIGASPIPAFSAEPLQTAPAVASASQGSPPADSGFAATLSAAVSQAQGGAPASEKAQRQPVSQPGTQLSAEDSKVLGTVEDSLASLDEDVLGDLAAVLADLEKLSAQGADIAVFWSQFLGELNKLAGNSEGTAALFERLAGAQGQVEELGVEGLAQLLQPSPSEIPLVAAPSAPLVELGAAVSDEANGAVGETSVATSETPVAAREARVAVPQSVAQGHFSQPKVTGEENPGTQPSDKSALKGAILARLESSLVRKNIEIPVEIRKIVAEVASSGERAAGERPVETRVYVPSGAFGAAVRKALQQGLTENVGASHEDSAPIVAKAAPKSVAQAYGQPTQNFLKIAQQWTPEDLLADDGDSSKLRAASQPLSAEHQGDALAQSSSVANAKANVQGPELMTRLEAPRASTAEAVERVLAVAKESMRVWVRRDLSAMEVHLDPPELGRIQLRTVVHEGRLGAQIQTETSAARDMLQAHVQELKEVLRQQNITVVHMDIQWGDWQRQGQESGRRRAGAQFDFESLLAEEDPAASSSDRQGYGLIDRVA